MSSLMVSASEMEDKESQTFYCKFCSRKFSTMYAFSCHQNAHKHERVIAEREKPAAVMISFTPPPAAAASGTDASDSVGSRYHPYYSAMGVDPLRNKAIGFLIQPHSTIRTPTRPPVGPHGYQWWSRQQYMAAAAAATQQSQSLGAASGGFLQEMELMEGVNNGGNRNLSETGSEAIGIGSKNSSSSEDLAAEYNSHGLDLSLKL